MKKSLIALAVLAASGAAMAQSSVTLFGRIDAGLATQAKETTGADPVASKRQSLQNGNLLQNSYWGIKGTEDLGGGLKANFELQSQFTPDTGAGQANMFQRLSTVGFSGGFGAVNLGRQYTAYDTLRASTDNVLDTNVTTSSDVWKATGLANYTNRVDNSIRFDSAVYSGFSGSISYAFGENEKVAPNDVGDATNNISLHVKYAAGPLLVGYAHQEEKQPYAAVTAAGQNTRKFDLIGAKYNFGVAEVVGSYQQAKDQGVRKDKEWQVGVNVPVSAAALVSFGYSKSKSDGNAVGAADLDGRGYTLAGLYNLSKRTALYAAYVNIESDKVTKNGVSKDKTNTTAVGVRHLF